MNSVLFRPEVAYTIYLLTFPTFSFRWFTQSHSARVWLLSYAAVIGMFHVWLYLIGTSVLVFEYPILAVMGIVQILKIIALNTFTDRKRAFLIKTSLRNYNLYLIAPAEIVFQPAIDVRKCSQQRLLRGVIELVLLLAFNAFISRLTFVYYPVSKLSLLARGTMMGIQLSLCFQSLTDLSLAVFGFIFPDVFLEDVFIYPLLSSSPREFWSKRWNLVIQKYITKLVYIPLGGRHNKLLAMFVIYTTVGIMHELPMLFLPSAKLGYWFLIFIIHVGAMSAQFLIEKCRIWTVICNSVATKLVYRICTLMLLALTADMAYSGFGLSAEQMAKDFNSLFMLM